MTAAVGVRAGLDRLREAAVLVVGDAMLDTWSWGPPRGLSREGPVPVVRVTEHTEAPGGAANTAAAVAALGARARLVGLVGDDRDGDRLRRLLRARGVDTAGLITLPGRATLAKRRISSGGHLHLRCDTGDETSPGAAVGERLAASVRAAAADHGALLACDYAAGLWSRRLIAAVAAAARAAGRPLVVDAHDLTRWAPVRPDLVKPNAGETARLLPDDEARARFSRDRVGTVLAYQDALLHATGARAVAATLDRDGVVVLTDRGAPWHLPPAGNPVPDEQASGAGDTFVATLTTARCAGAQPRDAVELAAAAAAVVVASTGTSTCTADDLRARLGGSPPVVIEPDRLAELAARHRAAGRRIVFTNGCFDVLHAGHVAYLDAASRLGDVLIVGVNDDAGVRRLKGPDRPINPLRDRLAVLRALSGIGHVVVFTGDTPADLLRLLCPDVYVKGGDYTEEMLAEAPLVRALGGEVRIVDYVEDHSTSGVVGRIRQGAVATG